MRRWRRYDRDDRLSRRPIQIRSSRNDAVGCHVGQNRDKKPFFAWFTSTRMHIWTTLKPESQGKIGLGLYPDGIVEHDAQVASPESRRELRAVSAHKRDKEAFQMQVANHIDHAGKRRQHGRDHQPARRLHEVVAAFCGAARDQGRFGHGFS
jgi:hypothetical protein